MRALTIGCTLLLLSGLAVAQATIVGGYAGNWPPSYGVYAAPFVPLVVTPSVSLGTYSPSPAGASNATGGLVAGASNSTLDNVVYAPRTVFSVTHWYGPDAEELGAAEPETISEHGMHHERMHHERPFDAGIAAFQSSEGLATLAGLSKPGGKASRTITNQDVDQLNQNNGTVKYRGKTEKL